MKRLFRIGTVLIALLLALAATSCGKDEKGAKAEGDDYPITISVFTIQNQQQPPADNKIYKWIKERFNVEFTWDIAVGEKDQKIGVLIASGDYPDLLNVDSLKFIDAGALIPLEDLIEQHAPRLKKKYASAWEKMREADGHIYCLPNWGILDGRDQSSWYGDSAMWIQKEVLKEFGYPKVKTVEDYFGIIEKYKNKYPTIEGMPTIGYTILTYDWRAFCLINPPNFLAGYPNDGNCAIDPVTKKAKLNLTQDYSKRWFKILNEMNQKGLVDRASFVDNYDQYMAKLSSGRVLGLHDQYWQFQNATNSLISQGMYNRSMAPLPIVFDESIRPRYRNDHLPNLQRGYGISVNAKDPVRIIKFLDAQLAEDAQKVFSWGIKGEDYLVGDDGVPYRTQEMRDQQEDPTWILRNKAKLWYEDAPKLLGSYSDGNPVELNYLPKELIAGAKPEDVELWNAYGVSSNAELMDRNPPKNEVWFPMWQVATPDGSAAQIAWSKIDTVYRKYLPGIILGSPADFEKLWAEYVQAVKDAGEDDYVAFVQAALDERIAKWTPKK